MRRGWLLLLSVILLVWQPRNFAIELLTTLPSLGMRGAVALVELLAHGAVAVLCVAAGWALWTATPHGPALAAVALIVSAIAGVQSLYWSILPSQTMPGDHLPLAILIVAHATAWLAYLRHHHDDHEDHEESGTSRDGLTWWSVGRPSQPPPPLPADDGLPQHPEAEARDG
jgi:hypothetical protein